MAFVYLLVEEPYLLMQGNHRIECFLGKCNMQWINTVPLDLKVIRSKMHEFATKKLCKKIFYEFQVQFK